MSRCTWRDCSNEAAHPQIAKDGEQWANLCDEHNSKIDESIDTAIANGDVRSLLSGWVKAQGGAEAAAGRMVSPLAAEKGEGESAG